MESYQKPTVLVLGASGTIGSQVVKDLEAQGVNVRITSRKQEVVEQLISEGKVANTWILMIQGHLRLPLLVLIESFC